MFGSIGKFFEGAIKNPVVQAVFPVFAASNLLGSRAIHDLPLVAEHLFTKLEGTAPLANQDHTLNQAQGGYPYAYLPQQYGGSTWDYSTQSPVFSTPPPELAGISSPGYSTLEAQAWGEGWRNQ